MSITGETTARLADLNRELAAQIAAKRIPGAAMAVFHRGTLATAAAGHANVEAGIEVDDRTIFQIGSITKVFTATLMMQLVEQGRIELDAPVRRYLPELRIARALAPDTMTVRTLLDYSSGMEGDFFGDFGPGPKALARYVDACGELDYVHPPGAMRSYNSTAYGIAGRVIEVVANAPFDHVLAEQLLTPIGCERFAFYTHDVARYRTAVGHLRCTGAPGFQVAKTLRLPHALSPAGASLTTTATDLLRFGLLHLHGGVTQSGTRLLSESGIVQMRTPSRTVPPGKSELLMGWATVPTSLGPLVVASGRTIEQNSILVLLPGHDFCASILTNCTDGGDQLFLALGMQLLKDCTGAVVTVPSPPALPDPPPVMTASDAAPYLGRFCSSYRFDVSHEDGRLRGLLTVTDTTSGEVSRQRLWLVRVEGECFAAVAEGATAASSVIEFVRTGTGPATHLATGGRLFARRDPPPS